MHIEIDQSIKIEQTNRDTVVAFSNGTSRSLLIRARDKQELLRMFRIAGRRRVFVYKLFAVLVYLLIKDYLDEIEEIVIDREYVGWEALIKNYLLRHIRKIRPSFSSGNIRFGLIGKKSRAHALAYQVAVGRRKSDVVVGVSQIGKYVVQ